MSAELSEFLGDEPLHPDLLAYYESDRDVPCIRHPLVYSMFHMPMLNKSCNLRLAQKRQLLVEYTAERNWYGYVWAHERPYRVTALASIEHQVTDDTEWWSLVARVWTDSENIRQMPDEWEDILCSARPGREHMMDEEDQAALAAMPEVIDVYQGCTTERDDGWSWTTDRAKAKWFADRFAMMEKGKPLVRRGRVRKGDVVAYLTNRNESEVIVDPEFVEER